MIVKRFKVSVVLGAGLILLLGARHVRAHCDGMDGPVVKAAQRALQTKELHVALIWVQGPYEDEIRKVFQQTLAVRELSSEARELADRYFFEMLVRLHRAGEGAPYTGLKPVGRDLGPAIPAADRAIESGQVKELAKLLQDTVDEGLRGYFKAVLEAKNFGVRDVSGGREFVDAYVWFIHYVEHLYEAAKQRAEGHYPESKAAGSHN